MSDDATFDERLAAAVKRADEVAVRHFELMAYTAITPPTHRADRISDKWVRIVTVELRNGQPVDGSVYGFVAASDHSTKALGTVKRGDIHKADGWKRAARHARGSIFQDDFNGCFGPYGVVSLR